jgi:hypothetical protein
METWVIHHTERVRAYCAWKVVRKHKSWGFFDPATIDPRRCGSSTRLWDDLNDTLVMSGEAVQGSFGREAVR